MKVIIYLKIWTFERVFSLLAKLSSRRESLSKIPRGRNDVIKAERFCINQAQPKRKSLVS